MHHLFTEIDRHQIRISSHWDIDHLCYRVDSRDRYEELKGAFKAFAELLIESDVNGRPISTYQLKCPLRFRHWQIDLVELPAPKASKPTTEGFEHIEIVCDLPFSELEESYQHLSLDRGGLKKDLNPELELCLGARNLKFHPLSLKSVINLEKNPLVDEALKKSKVLKEFREYHPLVAGDFALGTATEKSTLDIYMSASDFDRATKELNEKLSSWGEFKIQRMEIDEIESLKVGFDVSGVSFRIFVQERPSVRQQGYLNFLNDERKCKVRRINRGSI